jgi:hypothetical protein
LRRLVHAPIRSGRKLAVALWLGACLTSAVLGADSTDLSCPDNSPLGGWIRMREVDQVRQPPGGCNQVVNIYMAFDLVPIGLGVDAQTAQQMEQAQQAVYAKLPPQLREQMQNQRLALLSTGGRSATKLKYKMWSDGCHDIGGAGLTCSMPGATASGEFVFDKHTPIGFLSTAPAWLSPQSVVFNPMNPSLQIPTLSRSGQSFLYPTKPAGECVGQGRRAILDGQDAGNGAFYVNIQPERAPICQGNRSSWATACVAATACFQATDPAQRRQCVVNPGKFAVIPFEGTQDLHSPKENARAYSAIVANKISWRICCGCGQAPPPPDFPKKSCPDTAEADAQLAKGNSQWDAYAKDLKVLWANYEEEMKKAESHLQQFQTTMRACNIQSGLTNVLIGTLGLFAPGVEAVAVAEEGTEAYEATKQAVEMLGPQVGDPAAALANVIQSLMNNEDPTAKLVPSEMFQQFTEAVEMAKNINTRISGSSLAQLEEGLAQCAGTIGLSNENWKGANDYIEELQAAMANVPASQVLVNDIKQLDNVTLPQLQYDVYAACVRHARCLNQPESSCDKLKPAGNWAPVQ